MPPIGLALPVVWRLVRREVAKGVCRSLRGVVIRLDASMRALLESRCPL